MGPGFGSGLEAKLQLLARCVWDAVGWKVARWPFQKSIATDMDQLQCKMISVLSQISRLPGESPNTWWRRRARISRSLAAKVGFWSVAWAEKLRSWKFHVDRSEGYCPVFVQLLRCRDSSWLQRMRAEWVGALGSAQSRNSVLAGRTGSRLNIGQPQPRWEESLALAEQFLVTRDESMRRGEPLGVGSRIVEAVRALQEMARSDRTQAV